ncbi:MAG: ubiquinol-cytochrome c reductase iron-sulfur subunit [Desulfuromonadales bacterium]|nr:ubiquinol-cytochrome c reductase iron-sulfur subunit [Desulfuromonadales bacterium]NIR33747.1 ubiquinol-cytochrome c reductase iron-sulfur subunit [Desulfuromonadales bacterium]NIS43743.1 ubiquinol-cytochrome c reductase iron-sulfur subunit [Desulfuromonadales bacterium]
MEQDTTTPRQRRFFLSVLLGGVGSAVAAATLWPVWRFLSPPEGAGEQEQVSIARSKVDVGQAHFFSFRGQPAVALQPQAGQFLAFSAVCTHLGCIIQWQSDKGEFLCPCHAGRFSAQGEVLGGPPPKALETLPVATRGDQIIVGQEAS